MGGPAGRPGAFGNDTVVGCALGGGGARGLAHIGVLKVLEEKGVYPQIITGTSIGALIGATYAKGMSPAQLEHAFSGIGWARWAYLVDLSLKRGGFMKGNRMMAMLRRHLDEVSFHELKLRFACVATDIDSGEEVVLSEGMVAEAVRASASVPGVFAPCRIGRRHLVDGGLVKEVPADICRRMGADYVIAVNVCPAPAQNPEQSRDRTPGVIDVLLKSTVITGHHLARHDVQHADLVIAPAVENIGFWQFWRCVEVVSLGEQAARKALDGADIHGAPLPSPSPS